MFLLSTNDIAQFVRLAQAEDFARKNRVLLLRHKPTETDIDISLGILPFEEEMVDRGSTKTFAALSIRLPTPEDLIIMKAIAHRPKDLDDIRTIADKYPDLDRKRIEEWLKSFGEALELPDLWNQIRPLLK